MLSSGSSMDLSFEVFDGSPESTTPSVEDSGLSDLTPTTTPITPASNMNFNNLSYEDFELPARTNALNISGVG